MLPASLRQRLEELLKRFAQAWQCGSRPSIEDYLSDTTLDHDLLLRALVHADQQHRHRAGEAAPLDDYLRRFPELAGTPVGVGAAATTKAQLETAADIVDTQLQTTPPSFVADLSLPRVPGYDVLRVLGCGGMGVVYQARHQGLQRLVALKMIRTGAAASPEGLARFRTEAEAIARLQHAHIVQIFEIGQHDQLPFFALEYCTGGSLDKKLAGTPLPPLEAAVLVEQLAQAVDAAHARGILHRDLKPANVLLTENGTPKIADFGLAKKLGEPGPGVVEAAAAGMTQTGAVIGTPSYMAPEQASGQSKRLGPACDLYALGAILYDCLTGRPPFKAATALDTLWQVLHQEPVAPAQLNPRVPRDLQTICLKCLRKEPSQRYATALQLAEDVQRFRRGEPIQARPVSTLERVRKWAQRRPAVAALSAALVLATLLLVVSLTVGMVRTQEALEAEAAQRGQAEQARATALAKEEAERAAKELALQRSQQLVKANDILTTIFRDLNPRAEAQAGLTLQEQLGQHLQRAAQLLEGTAVGDPLTVAHLQVQLGEAQLNLDYADQAVALFTKARRVFEAQLGADHPDTLSCMNNLGLAYQALGQWDKAVPLLEETVRKKQAVQGADHADTLTSMNNLAMAYHAAGQWQKALRLYEETVPKMKATLGADHPHTLNSTNNLALAYHNAGQWRKALPLLEATLQQSRSRLGADHPDTLTTMNNLALVYQAAGQGHKALALYEETLQKRQAKLGALHRDTLRSLHNLATAYLAAGQVQKALALYEEILPKQQAKLGADHPDTLQTMNNLAWAYRAAGQLHKAVPLYEEAMEKMKAKLGLDHPHTLATMGNLAKAYQAAGKLELAVPLFEETLKLRQAKLGADHPNTLTSMNDLADAQWTAGQHQPALSLFEQTLALRKVKLGTEHPDTLQSMNILAEVYAAAGKLELAVPLFEETLKLRQATLGADHPDTQRTRHNLGGVYFHSRRYADAEPLLTAWLDQQRPKLAADDLQIAACLVAIGECRVMLAKYVTAEAALRDSLAILQKKQPNDILWHHSTSLLGAALAGQQKYADAEPLLLQSANVFKANAAKLPAPVRPLVLAAVQRVIDLYDAWQRPDDAQHWRKELEKLKAM
jgi:hypothetical protein